MPNGKAALRSFLVTAIPITKNNSGALSYFSASRLAPGTLVKAPVRNGYGLAIVLTCRDVRSAKTEIRRAGFLLKKIKQSDILEARLPASVMLTLREMSQYYATSMGALLALLLPKVILDHPEKFLYAQSRKARKMESGSLEPLLFQMESEERFGQYRSLVRQSFARGASLMFVVPTKLDAMRMLGELNKGIAEFVHVFTGGLKKAEMESVWTAALLETHPILFITTPSGLFFPRPDIDTIIIERENSRAYRTLAKPYLNLKVFISCLARNSEKQLVLGDSVLSLETLWKSRNHEYSEMSLIRWRLPASPSTLVDARSRMGEKGKFEIFSPELRVMMDKAVSENERVFLFGARKGLSPTTVCGDCGTVLHCVNCGAGLVLHKRGEINIYICHACGARRDSTTRCNFCGSWKLVPLGIGTQQIARELALLYPSQHIFILDKDSAPNDRKAINLVRKFQETGGIMVGTELAFFYLNSVSYSGLVSVDTLFSVPDFSINERIFYIVSRLREMTRRETVIQTRNIGKQILAWANTGNIIDFYQAEIEERESLLYPPFSIFIKIIVPARNMSEEINRLKVELAKWQPDVLKDSLIIRIPRLSWVDPELSLKLSLLGPQFSIKVDTESIL